MNPEEKQTLLNKIWNEDNNTLLYVYSTHPSSAGIVSTDPLTEDERQALLRKNDKYSS